MRKGNFLFGWGVLLVAAGLFAVAAGCGGGDDAVDRTGPSHGIVVFNGGWIGVIDSATQTVSTPFLVGELGTAGAGLFDAVMTPDGATALVSSFGSDNVFIIDVTDPTAPGSPDNVTLSFFPEDIAVTPNGRYAIVTDGGASPKIAVIDVTNRALVEEFPATPVDNGYAPSYQAVAVSADGQTVLTVDYGGGQVNVLTIGSTGHLTYVEAIDISPDNTLSPVNVSISPDGRTAIVATIATGDNTAETIANMVFPVLRITAPGVVEFVGTTAAGEDFISSQSVAFNPAGTKAYVNCVRAMPDPAIDNTDDPAYPRNAIAVLNVTAPGVVANSGTSIPVEFIGRSQLFGVDTLAVTPGGHDLYVSNMTLSGAKAQIQVVDLTTNSVTRTIAFDNVLIPGDSDETEAIPTGVYFSMFR
ncbi:MAG: beta-propeller fold lactonase family protein [Deltaproteobacteria bacterium]|nr:beta-propeller fold lactonase family protein [Deltaproteobacteria bacterium]